MDPSVCHTTLHTACMPADCRGRCALEVIDELLTERSATSGEEADLLLDLRWKLGTREGAEDALRLFCDLRRRMETRHYLAFFRLRRWLETHLLAAVRNSAGAEPQFVGVPLDHYCVEAIRRVCLCAALGLGPALIAPHLDFQYRPVRQSGDVTPPATDQAGDPEWLHRTPPGLQMKSPHEPPLPAPLPMEIAYAPRR